MDIVAPDMQAVNDEGSFADSQLVCLCRSSVCFASDFYIGKIFALNKKIGFYCDI